MATSAHKSAPETIGHKAGEEAKKVGEKVGEQAKNLGERVGEQAKNLGEKVGEGVKSAATTAVQKTEDATAFLGQKADQATEAVGSGMKSLGGTIREHTPKEGALATAGTAVADTLESGGRYLEEHKLGEIGEDVTNMIRRNPIPAVLIAAGLGFVLARAMRS